MMDEEDKKLKASHGAIEDAIRAHLNALDIEGIMTAWVIGVSVTHFEDDDEYDGLYTTTSESLSKWSHIGITTAMLDSAKDYGAMDE